MASRAPAPFGALLRQYRLAAHLTQEELAERANISARAISDLERGLKQAPRRITLQLLVDALELSMQDRAELEHAIRRDRTPLRIVGAGEEPSPDSAQFPLRGALPLQPTSFIGRERELEDARALLLREDVRLLSLTGTGGVGKTRLALRLATTL